VGIAVEMRAKEDAFFGHFAKGIEAEDLKAAGVCEDGARPGHEFVEAAQTFDAFVAGT